MNLDDHSVVELFVGISKRQNIATLAVALAVSALLASERDCFGVSRRRFVACLANVENISLALEMYSTDHDGDYPTSLDRLVPN